MRKEDGSRKSRRTSRDADENKLSKVKKTEKWAEMRWGQGRKSEWCLWSQLTDLLYSPWPLENAYVISKADRPPIQGQQRWSLRVSARASSADPQVFVVRAQTTGVLLIRCGTNYNLVNLSARVCLSHVFIFPLTVSLDARVCAHLYFLDHPDRKNNAWCNRSTLFHFLARPSTPFLSIKRSQVHESLDNRH